MTAKCWYHAGPWVLADARESPGQGGHQQEPSPRSDDNPTAAWGEGGGMGNKAEIDVSLELSCFFDDPVDVGNLISGSSAFSKTSLNIRLIRG